MRYDLKLLARQATRRKSITLREIEPLKRDQDALQRIYLEVVRHWEGARGRLVEAYGRELAIMESAGTFDSIDDMQDTIDTEASWFANAFLSLEVQITAWSEIVERWHRDRWARIAQPYIPSTVNLNTLLTAGDVQQTLEATIKGNLALIRDVDAQTRSKMAEAIFRGLNQRLPARDVAKELSTITGFARKRTLLIASQELQKITASLDRERQAQAGIKIFSWAHSRKRHPRVWHQAREGKQYYWATRKAVDGSEVIPADDMAGIPIRCGCKARAVLILDDAEESGGASSPEEPQTISQKNKQNEQDGRDYVLTQGRRTGKESLIGYDTKTGAEIGKNGGGKSHVEFTPQMLAAANDRNNSLVFHHNHPSSSSFSRADVYTMIDSPGMKGLWAHGHDESSYYIERGAKKFSKKEFEATRSQIILDLQSAVRARMVSPDEAASLNNHILMLIMNGRARLKYEHSLSGESARIARDKSGVIEAILGARK